MLERLICVYDLGGKEYTLKLRRKLCCTLTHFNKVSMKLQPVRLLLYRKNRKFVLSKANSIFHKNKINAEAEFAWKTSDSETVKSATQSNWGLFTFKVKVGLFEMCFGCKGKAPVLLWRQKVSVLVCITLVCRQVKLFYANLVISNRSFLVWQHVSTKLTQPLATFFPANQGLPGDADWPWKCIILAHQLC